MKKKVKKIPLEQFIKDGIKTTISAPKNNLLRILSYYKKK